MESLNKEHTRTLDDIRIQMLFVLYGCTLLHSGRREEYLDMANQFASNRIFEYDSYKNILLN